MPQTSAKPSTIKNTPRTMAEVSQDGDVLLAQLTKLYRRGDKAFYGGFSTMVEEMKQFYNTRTQYGKANRVAPPFHALEDVIHLWRKRNKYDNGSWSVDWVKMGNALGIQEEDDEGKSTAQGKGKAKAVEEEGGKGKGKERPRPNLITRNKEKALTAGPSKTPKETTTTKATEQKTAGKTTANQSTKAPKPASKAQEPPAPPHPKPKPGQAIVIRRPKDKAEDRDSKDTTARGAPPSKVAAAKNTQSKRRVVKSKSVVVDDTADEGDEEERDKTVAVAKWTREQATLRKQDQGRTAEASGHEEGQGGEGEGEGGGDSIDPEEDVSLYEGDATEEEVSNDSEGPEPEPEAEEDTKAAPLVRGKKRAAKTVEINKREFHVFARCAACTKLNIGCNFTRGRLNQLKNGQKVSCNHCKKLRKGCEVAMNRLTLDTPLAEYQKTAFPAPQPAPVPAAGAATEGTTVKSVGDLLTTLLLEQRAISSRLTTVEQKLAEVGTGMDTSPQHVSGVSAAVAELGRKMGAMEKQRQEEGNRLEIQQAARNGSLAAAIDALGTKVAALEKQSISPASDISVIDTLQRILEKLEKSTPSPSSAPSETGKSSPPPGSPSPPPTRHEDASDDGFDTRGSLSPIREITEAGTLQEKDIGLLDDADDDDDDDEGQPKKDVIADAEEPEGGSGMERGDETVGEEANEKMEEVIEAGVTAGAEQGAVGEGLGAETGASASRGPPIVHERPRRTCSMSRMRDTSAGAERDSLPKKPMSTAAAKRKADTSPQREASKSTNGGAKKKTSKKVKM